jgi:monothiol glutaredoxin
LGTTATIDYARFTARKQLPQLENKNKTSMKPPTITAYLKTSCGWSQGVRSIMRKYNLAYEDRDIIINPLFREEMIEKSGQRLSPCVEVDGHLLVDVNGDEVEAYLLQAGLVQLTAVVADAPTDRSCDAHHPG